MAIDTPFVSIIMPVFNAERTLSTALRSIMGQTHERWELVLIDDGSRDATLATARRHADPRIKVIEGGANLGLAVRLNQAIGLSHGDYIARMDADDIAYPERIATQVAFMLTHPECDLVGSALLVFDDTGVIKGKLKLRTKHDEICASPWSGFALPHPTWLGKRDWFERFGYRPEYKTTQDQDLLLRSFRESRFACIDQILLGYRQDRRRLKKLLAGRLNFARSITIEAARQGAWRASLVGLAEQGAKALVDVLTVPLGLDRLLRSESGATITAVDEMEWRAVWAMATDGDVPK